MVPVSTHVLLVGRVVLPLPSQYAIHVHVHVYMYIACRHLDLHVSHSMCITVLALPILYYAFKLCYCCCEIKTVYVCDCHPTPLPPQNPGVSDVYIEHSVQATVAQYAPSGYYIASGGKHACRRGD